MSSLVKTVTKHKPLSRNRKDSDSMTDELMALKNEAVKELEVEIKEIADFENAQAVGIKYSDVMCVDGQGASLLVKATFTTRAKPKVV